MRAFTRYKFHQRRIYIKKVMERSKFGCKAIGHGLHYMCFIEFPLQSHIWTTDYRKMDTTTESAGPENLKSENPGNWNRRRWEKFETMTIFGSFVLTLRYHTPSWSWEDKTQKKSEHSKSSLGHTSWECRKAGIAHAFSRVHAISAAYDKHRCNS